MNKQEYNWCGFGFHKWTRWGDTYDIQVKTDWGERFVHTLQKRTCEQCGKVKIKKLYKFRIE
jgi:hypothetical protein